jgi:hypothetical protein
MSGPPQLVAGGDVMASRVASRSQIAIIMLSLAAALIAGSLVGTDTLSWGKKFILWQLSWWLFVSVAMSISIYYMTDFAMRSTLCIYLTTRFIPCIVGLE